MRTKKTKRVQSRKPVRRKRKSAKRQTKRNYSRMHIDLI